jgi:hypothetical protein
MRELTTSNCGQVCGGGGNYSSYSDLLVFLQRPDDALEKLDRSGELSSAIDFRLKQALIASAFGQPNRALGYIELAWEVDSNRPLLLPSRRALIQQMEPGIGALRALRTN